MNRRTFSRQFALVSLAAWAGTKVRLQPGQALLKPARLAVGQCVGLITPASYLSDDKLEKAVQNLESLELKVQLGKHIRKRHGTFAGTDAERLSDLHAMFADPAIDA
ncbi:MAG: LD-carboxypeptidase, partial [Bacteroidetes bacterium]